MANNNLTSIVIEDSAGTHQLGVDALLAAEGKLFITDDINAQSAAEIIKSMMYLADSGTPIKLYIDCCGGEIRSGLAIVDAMDILSHKVTVDVICIGKAYSMASVILAAGTKGHRSMLPHSEVMMHEPLIMNGAGGSASSVKNTAESLISVRDKISDMLSRYTGLTIKKINSIMRANTYMSAEKAIELGIADNIASSL